MNLRPPGPETKKISQGVDFSIHVSGASTVQTHVIPARRSHSFSYGCPGVGAPDQGISPAFGHIPTALRVLSDLPVTRSGVIRTDPPLDLSVSDSAILRQLRVPPGDCRNISLFGSQCLHRIEARCTPRGNDTCERGHREQRRGNCGINRRIERLNLIEQVAH